MKFFIKLCARYKWHDPTTSSSLSLYQLKSRSHWYGTHMSYPSKRFWWNVNIEPTPQKVVVRVKPLSRPTFPSGISSTLSSFGIKDSSQVFQLISFKLARTAYLYNKGSFQTRGDHARSILAHQTRRAINDQAWYVSLSETTMVP